MGIQKSLRYGASELKRTYNRYLGTALILSIALHAGGIGLYLLCVNVGRAALIVDGSGPTVLCPPPTLYTPPLPPPPEGSSGPGSGSGAGFGAKNLLGTPVSTDDTNLIAKTDPNIMIPGDPTAIPLSAAGLDDKNRSTCTLRPDTVVTVAVAPPKHSPRLEDFVSVEKEPSWSQADLQSHLTYPEIAQRNNIEGMVVVRALIDEDGRVSDTHVDRADSPLLSAAAVDAIRHTRFKAAEQNHVPVAVWVQIPVSFKLSE